MPKGGKKGKKREDLLAISDITLHDFANCARPQSCGRVKRSVVSAMAAAVLPKTGSAQGVFEKTEEEDLSWFDKDLEDFVIEDPPGEEEEDLSAVGASALPSRSRKKAVKKGADEGVTYPLDLWYLLADFVHPEDIRRFAGICKDAHSVTQTSSFWRKLYERCYKKGKEGLPDHIKPHSMEKLHGLRARVIRSLFFLHPPLVATVQNRGPMDDEPHCLKGHRCLLAWHQPATKGWQFCFKFQRPSLQPLASRPVSKLDVYHGYNDLFYNPEGGCCVLQVTCCHFASVAAVMGLLLNQVYVTLSSGFRHHRLRLHFDSRISASQNTPSDTVVVLDDVLSIKLMDWWHPNYPFTT